MSWAYLAGPGLSLCNIINSSENSVPGEFLGLGFAPASDFVMANSDGCWDRPLLLHIQPCPCLFFQPVPGLQTARTLFWIQRHNISMAKPPSPSGSLPAELPAHALHPKALPLLLLLRDYFPVVIRTEMWYSPGRCSWQKCQFLPQGWKHGWLEAWQAEVASSLTEPMCATRLCQLALSRSERHSAFCPGWKRRAEEEGFRVKAAKGLLGMHSCQLTVCGGGGGAEQQEHSRTRKSLLCLGHYLPIAAARRMWMNGSIFFFIDVNTEGLPWLSFLIKRMLVWWIIAWLFPVPRDVGGTALHIHDQINRSDLHIYIQLQKSHQCFCWSPTNPHLLKALLSGLWYRDIVISFLSKTQNYQHLFADVLKCAGSDCRLIAHNVSVQDSNRILQF